MALGPVGLVGRTIGIILDQGGKRTNFSSWTVATPLCPVWATNRVPPSRQRDYGRYGAETCWAHTPRHGGSNGPRQIGLCGSWVELLAGYRTKGGKCTYFSGWNVATPLCPVWATNRGSPSRVGPGSDSPDTRMSKT
ncbi:hypothetical protein TNCT_299491 [Trichonephila clavata]|uniref:Uncharacterized protein n=1 Tax=Trichonephila clavata TaxID=2740835 RepID=A0A8X6LK45_TRICU|nr:hypothetical protein TNCT_299491 [Trichonephila clavata]